MTARVRADRTKQLAVLRPAVVNEARHRMGLRIKDLARTAGVGYGSAARGVKGEPIGADLAERIASALGLQLAETAAPDDERRPASGYSPEAMEHFCKLLKGRFVEAMEQAYRATTAEAGRRCWFWPGIGRVQKLICVRRRTEEGEVDLL